MSTAKPQRGERTVTVLDVGTSKVAALIALIGANGADPRVIGVGQRVCHGVRRGLVADMEKTESAIRAAVDQAERNAGVQAEAVYVNMSAGGLRSEVENVEIDIGGHKISAADMTTLLAAGRARIDPGSRTVLHAQPALYSIDGLTGVQSPVGFHADRLGMDIHIVTADTPPIRNLDLAVRSAHLGVRTMVASPAASSLAVLAAEERELGVALVEIGAGVTNIAVHMMGQLVGVASIAMGAGDITNDIASAFATRRSHAERLKTLHGAAITAQKDNHDIIEVPPISDDDTAEPLRVPKSQIVAVVRHRLDLLFGEVALLLPQMGFTGPQARQVVLTGGGAEIKSIADFAQGVLGKNVRLGRPRGLTGLPDAQSGCAFATLAGLALFAAEDLPDMWNAKPSTASAAKGGKPSGRLQQMVDKLRSSL
ncbi:MULTISPECIES: cell division protein FtsA [Sphingosinicellaceae]|uniref:cell division protein FtsA n=1 Tax=Sphingosinicellaceae TaxID=2820280 RepID=UPI001C1E26D2|nr:MULTISPECIES: cell division protein FtsA [Polymorphobacter]QYE35085.1 cell division protein FtsA [Polymorphobacter sp. PAMC 29334]UAJ11567.1 cell division protein FtsA [Polymorphobacter megasporae]